jgi:hypothetical protein
MRNPAFCILWIPASAGMTPIAQIKAPIFHSYFITTLDIFLFLMLLIVGFLPIAVPVISIGVSIS